MTKSYTEWLTLVQKNGSRIKDVPIEIRTKSMYMMAIMNDPSSIQYFPEEMQTEDILLISIMHHSNVLQNRIPREKFTQEMYFYILQNYKPKDILKIIPKELRTKEFCFLFVENLIKNNHIKELKCKEMYEDESHDEHIWEMEEIDEKEYQLKYKIYPDRDRSYYYDYFDDYSSSKIESGIKYITSFLPIEMSETEYYLELVKRYKSVIHFIPEDMRTEEMYVQNIEKNGMSLFCIPEDKQTESICLAIVKQNGLLLNYVINPTFEIYLAAAQQNPDALEHVCEHLTSDESEKISLAAVEKDGLSIHHIYEGMIEDLTEEAIKRVHMAAVKQNGLALKYTDYDDEDEYDLQTFDLCMEAVKQNGLALQYVKEKFKTVEVCKAAILQNPKAIEFVKDKTLIL